MKQFVALARVSSREQEREGFSLAVQEDALKRYADSAGGRIVRLFRIAETASKTDERKAFRELIAFAKKNAEAIDGLLFYKVDRAARNLFDYVELERLESEYGVPFISVSQPTDNNPAGRMMRRTLANMASFYTEQQSVDVREGLARRVQEGWFVGKAPYGYRNVRKDGRCVSETDAPAAANVRRIFQLFAYEPLTLDALVQRLHDENVEYRPDSPRFTRSKVHVLLQDRSYLGEIPFKGQWYPGKQEQLVDRGTWDRVQALLGGHVYQAHETTYGSEFTQLRDRLASIKLQLDVLDRSHDENTELAVKVFELSQTLRNQWVAADYTTKRRILEIVCLNCRLDGVNLVPTTRKPFDVLVEGLISQESRGDRI